MTTYNTSLIEAAINNNDWYDAAETVAIDFGTDAQAELVWELQAEHDEAGYLTNDIKARREPLGKALNVLLQANGLRRYL